MNESQVTLVGLELLVGDISAATEVFTEALGCSVAWQGRSADVDADVVVLDAGPLPITLISPTRTGGRAIAESSPRLSQLVFGGSGESVGEAVELLRRLGVGVTDDGRRYVPPKVAEGFLGMRTAIVLTEIDGTDAVSDDAR